jgi:cobalamin-dependent methionine synthase I
MLREVAEATEASLIGMSASVAGVLEPHVAKLAELGEVAPVVIGGHATTSALAERCHAMHLRELIAGATEVTLTRAS